ncbi:DUF445 domain-containing protein [Fervidibacillus albus]|uniref:DUF445 family protein n=1 Tax=Fervidibacillus albus TaxID=2980026 RepID=A0A9E8RU22_9BACI|nr:DUF445 family protein [Fervidibacillus albus]WAA08730.1 DUF445 family protein [Fervidibacillus albus]
MISIATVFFMAIIGAIIGGMTNSLAIKMLFRPYEPIYIRNWRLPFTPGLIPKRRKEMARQLGYLVVDHLVTPETIQKKLAEGPFLNDIKRFLKLKIHHFLNTNQTISDWFQQIHLEMDHNRIQQKMHMYIDDRLEKWLNNNRNKTLNGLIPLSIWSKLDDNVEQLSKVVMDKLIDFIKSDKGEALIEDSVNKFLDGIKIGPVVQLFLDSKSITIKIQMELVRFLQSNSSRKQLAEFIRDEVDRMKGRTVSELLEKLGEGEIKEAIAKELHQAVDIDSLLHQPISNYFHSEEREQIAEKVSESIVRFGMEQLSRHVEQIMDKLQIVEMVEQQVDSFSTKRLEELVLTISGRELKMITYLGAYLGGLIGLIQGILVLFLK